MVVDSDPEKVVDSFVGYLSISGWQEQNFGISFILQQMRRSCAYLHNCNFYDHLQKAGPSE